MAETNVISEASREERHQEPPQYPEPHRILNVGEGERYLSILGGVGLVLAGISRRGLGGLLLAGLGAAALQRGVRGYCPLYNRLGVSSFHSDRPGVPDNVGTKVERSITIHRPAGEIFGFWRDFKNLPRFMEGLERVEILDERRSHWVALGPGGATVEWDAQIINEHPGELIAWESVPGASVQNAGSVRFEPAPGDRGTEVKISLEYNPPGGVLGSLAAKLFGAAPGQQVEKDLIRLRQLLEAGEVATTAGQPTGRS